MNNLVKLVKFIINDGLQSVRTSEFRLVEAELYRVEDKCFIALGGDGASAAEGSFQRAIETARAPGRAVAQAARRHQPYPSPGRPGPAGQSA